MRSHAEWRRFRGKPALCLIASLVVSAVVGGSGRDARAGIDDLLGTEPGELVNGGNFLNADNCSSCHGKGFEGDFSVLPFDGWAGTMMGNAARDPVFFAALTVANQDTPGVGTYCLRCHSPIAFVRGHATPPDGSAFDEVDEQGIGCDTCHRMEESPVAGPTPYLVSNAQIFYDLDERKRGPYVACADEPMNPDCANSPAHEVIQRTSLGDSSLCGQCHEVTNPDRKLRDELGVETAFEFPLDTTYTEWQNSAFSTGAEALSCQDCHMMRKPGEYPLTSFFNAKKRPNVRTHVFVGGNHWGIEAVMNANPDRAASFPESFAVAKAATLGMLASATKLTVTGLEGTPKPGDTINLAVKVENLSGHKFPSGYAETRRAWLSVVLVDAEGKERALLGGYDVMSGEIAETPPTRIYRALHGAWNGTTAEVEEHLSLHDSVVSDSRIPPKGFVPTVTTAVKGPIDYADGEGGFRNFDEAPLVVTLPTDLVGKQTLEVRVNYQSMTVEYVKFLQAENVTDTRGDDLARIFDETGRAAPLVIGQVSQLIDFGGEPGVGGAGGTGGGGEASGGAPSVDIGGAGVGCAMSPNPRTSSWFLGVALAWLARRRGAKANRRWL